MFNKRLIFNIYVLRKFGESCSMVETALVNQIKTWNGPDGCNNNGGEKCLYAVSSFSGKYILQVFMSFYMHCQYLTG